MGGKQRPHGEEREAGNVEVLERRKILSRTPERVPEEIKVDRPKATQIMEKVGVARISETGKGINFIFDNGDRFTLSIVAIQRLISGKVEFAGVSFCDKWGKSGVPKVRETTQDLTTQNP